jgi:hypothetical protein
VASPPPHISSTIDIESGSESSSSTVQGLPARLAKGLDLSINSPDSKNKATATMIELPYSISPDTSAPPRNSYNAFITKALEQSDYYSEDDLLISQASPPLTPTQENKSSIHGPEYEKPHFDNRSVHPARQDSVGILPSTNTSPALNFSKASDQTATHQTSQQVNLLRKEGPSSGVLPTIAENPLQASAVAPLPRKPSRLPTLREVLTRQASKPYSLFDFYLYMRDIQRSVDYLDIW